MRGDSIQSKQLHERRPSPSEKKKKTGEKQTAKTDSKRNIIEVFRKLQIFPTPLASPQTQHDTWDMWLEVKGAPFLLDTAPPIDLFRDYFLPGEITADVLWRGNPLSKGLVD